MAQGKKAEPQLQVSARFDIAGIEPLAKVSGKDGFFAQISENGDEPRYRILWKGPGLHDGNRPVITAEALQPAWELVALLVPAGLDRGLAFLPKRGIGIRLPAEEFWTGAALVPGPDEAARRRKLEGTQVYLLSGVPESWTRARVEKLLRGGGWEGEVLEAMHPKGRGKLSLIHI